MHCHLIMLHTSGDWGLKKPSLNGECVPMVFATGNSWERANCMNMQCVKKIQTQNLNRKERCFIIRLVLDNDCFWKYDRGGLNRSECRAYADVTKLKYIFRLRLSKRHNIYITRCLLNFWLSMEIKNIILSTAFHSGSKIAIYG